MLKNLTERAHNICQGVHKSGVVSFAFYTDPSGKEKNVIKPPPRLSAPSPKYNLKFDSQRFNMWHWLHRLERVIFASFLETKRTKSLNGLNPKLGCLWYTDSRCIFTSSERRMFQKKMNGIYFPKNILIFFLVTNLLQKDF